MSRTGRLSIVALLSAAGLLADARTARAQFAGGFGLPGLPGVGGVGPLPGVGGVRPFGAINPFGLNNGFRYQSYSQFSPPGPLGSGLNFTQNYSGPVGFAVQARFYQSFATQYYAPPRYNGYITGGTGMGAVGGANRDFARAQNAAVGPAVLVAPRNAIADQGTYERSGSSGPAGPKPGPAPQDALGKALAATDDRAVASGEALNVILAATLAAEAKGPKPESAYLSPNLLAEVRFAGPPAADALNMLRRAGRLDIPVAFDTGALAPLRPVIDRDFAAAAAPVLAGKPADPTKALKLEETLKKARDLLAPMVKDLEFSDAAAARRFLNRMDTTAAVLKGAGGAAVYDPKWAGEGTSVADLVRHMARFKLEFGAAAKGDEDAYFALHRGLAAYLMTLKDNQKPAPKK